MKEITTTTTAPACPTCGAKKVLVSCYQGGRGYVSTMVCPVKWASDDDVCGEAKCERCNVRRADPTLSTPGHPFCGKCWEGGGY